MLIYYNIGQKRELPPFAILCGGQSNMVGASLGFEPSLTYQREFTNVNFEGAPLQYGVNYFGVEFGFDLAFAKEFSDTYQTSNAYLEKEAVGGTDMDYWLTTVNLNRLKTAYSNLKARVSGIPDCKIFFLWVQGENDGLTLPKAQAYESNFTSLVNQLESTHGAFDKIILNQLREIPLVPFEAEVRAQQISYVNNNSPKAVGWDMTPYSFADGVHYDVPSMYQMGKDLVNIIRGIY